MADATACDACTWSSNQVPPTICRPWRVFEEDLEDQLEDTAGEEETALAVARERLAVKTDCGRGTQFE